MEKIIIFLCRVEVLSCETHRYLVATLELREKKKRKKKLVNHSGNFKANQNYHGWLISLKKITWFSQMTLSAFLSVQAYMYLA